MPKFVMLNPLELKSTAELRQILKTLKNSEKNGLFYLFAVSAEQELLLRFWMHPATEATYAKYQTLGY